MKTCWGSSLVYNTHTNRNNIHDKKCGQMMLLTLRAERSDNLFRRSSPHLLQKHLLLSLPMTQDAHFTPQKSTSKPSRLKKKNPAFSSNEKQYWVNINGLQWFHEHIHCIFMQLAVARGNKLAKTPLSVRGKRNIYAPAIRSFSFFILQNESARFLPLSWWFCEYFVCVFFPLAPLSLLRF